MIKKTTRRERFSRINSNSKIIRGCTSIKATTNLNSLFLFQWQLKSVQILLTSIWNSYIWRVFFHSATMKTVHATHCKTKCSVTYGSLMCIRISFNHYFQGNTSARIEHMHVEVMNSTFPKEPATHGLCKY